MKHASTKPAIREYAVNFRGHSLRATWWPAPARSLWRVYRYGGAAMPYISADLGRLNLVLTLPRAVELLRS